MESAQKLFTKMYEQAGAAGAGAAGGPTPEAGPAPEGFQGDDVVDGDYKESLRDQSDGREHSFSGVWKACLSGSGGVPSPVWL